MSMSIKMFSRKSKLILLYEKILEYCKNEILKDRIINIPNIITNNKKIPLYGLHSTTYTALENIYDNGFAANVGKRLGLIQDNPVIALFTIPFEINYKELKSNIETNPNITITISNGITRSITQNDIHNDDDYLSFPIILASFTKSDKVQISNDWITCYDNNDIHIVGHFDIKIKKDNNFQQYIKYRNKNEKKTTQKYQTKKYEQMLQLDYTVNFNKNIKFEEENTIPVSIIDDIKLGGKLNKKINKTRSARR